MECRNQRPNIGRDSNFVPLTKPRDPREKIETQNEAFDVLHYGIAQIFIADNEENKREGVTGTATSLMN